jgi:diacylglycerol kinase (ATP)
LNRKVFVLTNPAAGRNKVGQLVRGLSAYSEHLEEKITLDVHETTDTCRGTKTVQASLNSSHTDLIIVGGDGTINEAINGLKQKIPVGFIPAGSGDDYVKALGLPKDPKSQFATALSGKISTVDLGQCNDRFFVNGMGIGFDGQIVADMLHRKIPFLTGQAKYYYHVLQILSGYQDRSFALEIDKIATTKSLILLTIGKGTTYGGGFQLTPHAKLDDGLLAICEIGKISALKRWLNILSLQQGKHDVLDEVSLYHAKELVINHHPALEAHIDGEYLGKPPFRINVLPRALQVRLPA